MLWIVGDNEILIEHRQTVTALEKQGAQFFNMVTPGPEFDDLLIDFKVHSLLLEGGARLWKSFFDDDRVQRVHWFSGPEPVETDEPVYFHFKDGLNEHDFDRDFQCQLGEDSLVEYLKKN